MQLWRRLVIKQSILWGPLSRLWNSVDEYNSSFGEGLEDPPQPHIEDALQLIKQIVLLAGQC